MLALPTHAPGGSVTVPAIEELSDCAWRVAGFAAARQVRNARSNFGKRATLPGNQIRIPVADLSAALLALSRRSGKIELASLVNTRPPGREVRIRRIQTFGVLSVLALRRFGAELAAGRRAAINAKMLQEASGSFVLSILPRRPRSPDGSGAISEARLGRKSSPGSLS